eukprot:2738139-Lingulodinium_polyedra.AAC.1
MYAADRDLHVLDTAELRDYEIGPSPGRALPVSSGRELFSPSAGSAGGGSPPKQIAREASAS